MPGQLKGAFLRLYQNRKTKQILIFYIFPIANNYTVICIFKSKSPNNQKN